MEELNLEYKEKYLKYKKKYLDLKEEIGGGEIITYKPPKTILER